MQKRIFYALFIIVLLAGFSLRFYDLTKRPIHHDEGVIGWFKENILNACLNPSYNGFSVEGVKTYVQACGSSYTYDPDYHGPFEYLFGAWAFKVLGMSDFTLRLPEALFNFATILLLLPLRKKLGDVGTVATGALLAVSPSMVYYAQRAYMDNFFIFFTVGAIVCAVKFWENRKALWLWLGAADLALLFTTKETAYIFVFTALVFFLIEYTLQLALWKKGRMAKARKDAGAAWKFALKRKADLATAAVIFAVIFSFVFSTMFMDPSDVVRGVANGVTFWVNRSTTWQGHIKPFWYYTGLLMKYEQTLLFASVALAIFTLKKPFGRWCACWALASWLIFSFIPYKTPWLDIHFILPMAFVAGFGLEAASGKIEKRFRIVLPLALFLLLIPSALLAWDVTYVRYGDEGVGLVYVSPTDSYKFLVNRVESLASNMSGTDTEISVVSTDYWPLPWSLRDYKRAAWFGQSTPDQAAPIIISSRADFSEIREDLRGNYASPERYELRPGAVVYLYYRKGS